MDGATAIDLDQTPDGVYWTEDVAAPGNLNPFEYVQKLMPFVFHRNDRKA